MSEAAAIIAAAMQLITLHRIDGGVVVVNSAAVTSLHATAPGPRKNTLSAPGSNCIVGLYDGKIVSVVESCAQVRQLLEEATK